MLLHLFKHNLGCSKCSLCRLSVVILETNNATQPSGVYAQELKKRNIITRLHLWKNNLGCSKCRLCHLPVGFVGTKNATQPSGVYAQDLKKKRELRVYIFKNIIWDVLSVVSATYLWASWKPRYNSAKWSLVYAQALKIRWIRNWMAKKRLDSVLVGILYI